MHNVVDLKAALTAALFQDKYDHAIWSDGRAYVGVLTALHVDFVGAIALEVSEHTCRQLLCLGTKDSAGAICIGSRLVRTSHRWEDTLNRVSHNH